MIGIIDYGMGNLRSVQKAIEFLGGEAVISSEMRTLDGCERLILPGVGSFAAGMKNLTETGLADYVLAPHQGYAASRDLPRDAVFALCERGRGRACRAWSYQGTCRPLHAGEESRTWAGTARTIFPRPLFEGIMPGTQFYFVHSYYAQVEDAGRHCKDRVLCNVCFCNRAGECLRRPVPPRKERGGRLAGTAQFYAL